MSIPQFSIRIPPTIDKQVKQFAKDNNITKTKVMIDALNHYLGNIKQTSLNQKLHENKQKISAIELIIKNKY